MTDPYSREDTTSDEPGSPKDSLDDQVRQRTAELEAANRALREMKAQFEAVYDHHYQLTGLIDREGRLLMGNRTALEFAGVEAQDVVGKHFWETPWWTHSQKEQRKLKDAIAKALRGQMSHFQSTHVSVSGDVRNIDFRIRPVFDQDGDVIYLVPEGYDITDRLQAEESLRQSEEKYRTFFQNSCDPMLMLANGLVFDGNSAALAALGYQSVAEIANLSPAEFSPEFQSDGTRSVEKATAMMKIAYEKGTHRFEWEHRKHNGEVFPVEVSITVTPSEREKVLLVVWRDISLRRRAEESLHRQADFDSIITRVLTRFANCSADETEESIETSLKEIAQFTRAENAWFTLLSPDQTEWSVVYHWAAPGVPNYLSEYQNIPMGTIPWTEGKVLSGEIIKINDTGDFPPEADAERLLFEREGARSQLIVPHRGRDGQVIGSLGFRSYSHLVNWVEEDFPRILLLSEAIANALERKRTDESLQRSEERYRSLVGTMQDIIYSVSIDGRILFIGPQIERYGFTVEEIVSQPFTNFVIPEDRDAVLQEFQHTLTTGDQTIATFRMMTKAEKPVWFEEVGRLVRDAHGNISHISGMLRDITERKRTQELETQLQQSQKMEAIGTLAGGIAHDFNNILSAVIGYTEMLQMRVPTDSTEYEYSEHIYKAGIRAKDLVQQILTFSRQADPEVKPVEISIIIKEVTKLVRSSLPSTIEIKYNIQGASLVMGDPTQIHQIVMNLCTNAGHAMQAKGGLLTLELRSIELKDQLIDNQINLDPGIYAQLSVSDTGCGIPSRDLDRIFDPFFTTKARGEGTGMGLSVVHGIVKSCKGGINVYSEVGKGTTLNIFLPAIERRAEPDKRATDDVPTGTEHILFVDDEPPIVDIATSQLESLGYKVTSRHNSLEALELIKNKPASFDLVITDMTMPKMTGNQLAKEVKRIRPDIPVVLCTGFSSKITPENAHKFDIDALLMKPVILQKMSIMIRNLLDKKFHPDNLD